MLCSTKYPEKLTASIDEAGCGCLAGPLVTACVIWNPDCNDDIAKKIKDSKKCSEKLRSQLKDYILAHAIDYSVYFTSEKIIDETNIYEARLTSYHKVLDDLNLTPEYILVDGTIFRPYIIDGVEIPHETIIKGDDQYRCIAAASILAKYFRDEYMIKRDKEYPQYGWITNKGYGSKKHRDALETYGLSPYHRKTYGTCKFILERNLLNDDDED